MRPASADYAVTLRRTSRINRLVRWSLNLLLTSGPEPGRLFSVWPMEAVISDRRSGRVLRVVRNDSSGAEDAVADVTTDVDEMSADAFRRYWL